MTLTTKTPQQLTNDMTTAWASFVGVQPVFSSGDALLALFQAASIEMDFLQSLIVQVLALTSAQTSTGADLDNWMAQFFFSRLPAVQAVGPVTFSKLTPAVSAVSIPAGSIVQTPGGAIQYQVVADITQPTWNATANAYVLAPGQSSLSATVQSTTSGSAYNVAANALTQIATTIAGIDAVTNPSAISDGADAESDASFRARFQLYISTLAKATPAAVLAAALGVQQGVQATLVENQNPGGSTQMGAFTIFVDNGTGSPGTALLNSVLTAVNAVRACGIQPYVSGPTTTSVTIVIAVRVATGFTATVVQAAVQAALVAMVNALPLGGTLFISALEAAALAVAGVVAVQPSYTTINGTQADLVPAGSAEIRTSTGSVTVGTY